ncbi:MAG: PAS domain-containing sensor histidine kinase [Magnetovibrio sp.]|nr:PAS domain-containing sensor histidine kinase [Magnetovibrio sp.]
MSAIVVAPFLFKATPDVKSKDQPVNINNYLWPIVNNTAEGIIIIGSHGQIEMFNLAAEKFFGYTRDEVIGQNLTLLLSEEERSQYEQYLEQSELYEDCIIDKPNDFQGRRKDGTLFPISLNVARLKTDDKRFVGFLRDVTDRKTREQELVNAKVHAETANIAKTTFLSSINHEFRTPLNAIIGFSSLLESGHPVPVDPKQEEYLSLISSSAHRLLNLVCDILEMSEIETGLIHVHPQDIDIKSSVDKALLAVKERAAQANVSISNNCLIIAHEVQIYADPDKWHRILINVLSNAIKYNRSGGTIDVGCTMASDDMIRISITDTGHGIPIDKQHQIFEPFNRMGREAGTIEGTGVGLSITKVLVELLNGRIDFISTENEGSTFWIELPVAKKTNKHQGPPS